MRPLMLVLALVWMTGAARAAERPAAPPEPAQPPWPQTIAPARDRPFEGFTALVAEPENSWTWDSAVFGALEERGFEVTYGGTLGDPGALARYDLVALSIRRNLTTAEADAVKKYVAQGGALYGSWGGPFGASGFLQEVCRVGATRSVRLMRMALLKSPLSTGLSAEGIEFANRAGHEAAGAAGWEVVITEPLSGGIPVAADAEGHVLGVLSRHGKGRTAVLGFGPEQDKHLAKPALGPGMMDNLLAWLLEDHLKGGRKAPSNRVAVAVPARAEILEVYADGERVAEPKVRDVGSLKKVEMDVGKWGPGREASLRITYKPLSRARNVEAMIHLPWNTLRAAAESPAGLAEYLKSLNATVCQPLLRGSCGEAWYKGMPEDKPDDRLVKQYRGNFLADLLRECHRRQIRVVAGIYLDNATPLSQYPELKRLDRRGNEVKDPYGRNAACFHNPKGQAHSLATLKQLLADYDVDGVVLDDNFELDKNECCCPYCKEAFRRYCEAKGMAYQDPAQAPGEAVARAWRQCRREATCRLAAEVRRIAAARGVPAGGWVDAGMEAAYLAGAFDFLGGMVYACPPRSARGPLSVLGKCRYVCLLWAPGTSPQTLEQEVREAVRAGCATVGFWIRGEDGGYRMDAERTEAMRRAFAGVEKEWLTFYLDNVLVGDRRFVVVEGKAGREDLRLRIRNAGQNARRRMEGPVDVSALQEAPAR